jgi:hypothetical protein
VADEFTDLPGLAAFRDALVHAARHELELPGLDRFGRDLVARTRRRDRRRARWRGVALGALVALPIAATSGAATAVVLREAVISAPDPAQVPDEQTPLAGTATVSPVRAADPGGGLPWAVRVARGRTERHAFGASKENIPDPEGAQAWAVDRFTMGTRYSCAHVQEARLYGENRIASPTACLGLRASTRDWVADARTLHPGDHGTPGFDRWNWRSAPARTVVWGAARSNRAIAKVVLKGAGPPRALAITGGAFAAVLPASVDPSRLTLDVTLRDGTVEHGRPGVGLIPDLVRSRRAG